MSEGSNPPARPDESSDLSGRDDPGLLETFLTAPDRLHADVLLWADGRALPGGDPARRTLVGWHRAGGPVLVGVTTGEATDGLLLESFRLAAGAGDSPGPPWAAALADWWDAADPGLRERVVDRWGFEAGAIADPEAWTRQAWGAPPAPGPARTGVVAARCPSGLREAVDWLAGLGVEVAAWEVSREPPSETPVYRARRVAGTWRGAGDRPLPAEGSEERRRRTYLRHTGGVTAELLAGLESHCRSIGCEVAWSGEEWVRFGGPGPRSLRVFPGPAWIDLQFVGADEGTLIGLRFRYGVPVQPEPPQGAPPGVHLRLARPEDLSPEVRLLVTAWLGERSSENGEDEPPPVKRRPRKTSERERRPRNRSR